MEVKIQVDETKFKDILEKELSAFTTEELHSIIGECIGEYLRSNDYKPIEQMLFKNNGYYDEKSPTDLLKGVIAKCDYSDLQDVVDAMINMLKNNHEKILSQIIWTQISEAIANTYSLQNNINWAITAAIEGERSKGNIGNRQ